MRKGVLFLAPIALLTAGLMVACGSKSTRSSGFEPAPVDDGGSFDGTQGFTPNQTPCAGLACKQDPTTTLKGKVYDPAGSNALYNVMVYIPGGTTPEELPPMKDSTVEPDGIVCETCASVVVNPLVSALTDGKGEFTLENVPLDSDVPIVIQVGKWRRLLHVDITKKGEENKVPDKLLKLPKNGDEGNMPQIAVTSGGFDALECLLRGIGIDDKEFVSGHDGQGHIHMFKGSGGGMGTPAQDFWNDSGQLKKYDLVLLSCEGSEALENKGGTLATNPGARASMYEYLNLGGKVFATHYHYSWFKLSPQPEFTALADWSSGSNFATEYDVNQDFPKGEKFAEWLKETGGSTTLGKIKLEGVTNSLKTINDPALAWIKAGQGGAKYFTVNTPIASPVEEQCGRAVFSDVHITNDSGPSSISACAISSGGLNAQQKALEFLFFDLSACVTDDTKAPEPPK
jgi:hypothetical protein